MRPSEKKTEQTIDGITSYLILISSVHMSTSAKPAPGSTELTAILEDYFFYCCAVGPAGCESALFIERGKLERPACGVQGRMRLLSEEHVLNCFLLCTCKEESVFSFPGNRKTDFF